MMNPYIYIKVLGQIWFDISYSQDFFFDRYMLCHPTQFLNTLQSENCIGPERPFHLP